MGLFDLFESALDAMENAASNASDKLDRYERNADPNNTALQNKINERRETISNGYEAIGNLRSKMYGEDDEE